MSQGSSSANAQTRTRTFNGCSTCRARKVKCDNRRPMCSQCEKRKVACGGFEAKIQYVLYDPIGESFQWPSEIQGAPEPRVKSSRRAIYTDEQRKSMARDVLRSVDYCALDQVLDQLDHSSSTGQQQSASSYTPFSFFPKISTNYEDWHNFPQDASYPTGQPSNTVTACDNIDVQLDSLSPDSSESFFQPVDDQFISEEELLAILSQKSSLPNDTLALTSTSLSTTGFGDVLGFDSPSSFTFHLPWSASIENVPSQASFLLDHYKVQMVKLFSPKGSQKPPWGALHLPTAISTMSELTLWGRSSYAKTSLFFALLSVSAFNLDRINLNQPGSTNYWWSIGDGLRERAKQEIKQSLASEITGPKKSKYKEILMALLTMVTISVVSGRQTEARSFLLDAEHFICIRGIPKVTKSRKVRLLHQIYLFLRVIEESTHVYQIGTSNSAIAVDIYNTENSLFPSLKTNSSRLGKDLDALCCGNFESELIGRSMEETSLFGEIYGIPLSLLALISQTTSLANEMENNQFVEAPVLNLGLFRPRCQSLENAILGWQREATGSQSVLGEDVATNEKILDHLILAIHSALIVYFYRRIHDLHPQALQSHAITVIDHLAQCEIEKDKSSIVYNGIAWPGFIAAAEILDPFQRHRIKIWLQGSAQSSGFRNFDVAINVSEQLWRLRDHGRPRMSWIDLVREKHVALVLT